MSAELVYLDHAATTPVRPEAVAAMLPYFAEQFANPSGSHRFARRARQAVDESRDVVAEAIGCLPGEVVFTGSGTEADNTAIFGAVSRRDGVAVCSAAEHHAVLGAVEARHGRIVGVDGTGHVDLEQLAAALGPDVAVVSVMAVNNEVGTITRMGEVAEVVRRRAPGALLHTDAVQAVCWLDLHPVTALVDAMSFSAHKFGGPKGVGALVVRGGASLDPMIIGGGQERERRSGTHNVAGIVAMAEALRLTVAQRVETNERIEMLRDRLVDGLRAAVPDVVETVGRGNKVAGSAHVLVPCIENEALLYLLDEGGVCASAASACASGAMEPSHVLAAMGVRRELAHGALRLTLGCTTTEAEVDQALGVLVAAITRLRSR